MNDEHDNLSTEEHVGLRSLVRRFAAEQLAPKAAEHDRSEHFDAAAMRRLGDVGVLGVLAPERFGGTGLGAVAAAIVHEELASVDPGFTLAYLAHAAMFVHTLARSGAEALCARFLPDACAGRRIGAVAMSEPLAGTDLLAMRTRARRVDDGYRLEGTKTWITNGALACGQLGEVFLVYARSSDDGARGLSLFLLEKETRGLSLGGTIRGKLGMRSSTCAELVFADCFVPASQRVGAEGAALLKLMRALQMERLMLAAIGVGIARRALEVMNRYATLREASGHKLRELGQIQAHLGDSWAAYRAGRAYLYQTARTLGATGDGAPLDADGAKLFCARMAKSVADCAIQVLGGNGYVADYDVERLWRDARLLEIGGGTNESLQKSITRQLAQVEKIDP